MATAPAVRGPKGKGSVHVRHVKAAMVTALARLVKAETTATVPVVRDPKAKGTVHVHLVKVAKVTGPAAS